MPPLYPRPGQLDSVWGLWLHRGGTQGLDRQGRYQRGQDDDPEEEPRDGEKLSPTDITGTSGSSQA